ncbi:MAG: type II 3-dehydroquinate dehydratase [Candidatus Shikimatogenerans sp. JK-2022]|nr:type II 3-dehydroquinate dehydratase [Candidatus Shikimatogenerans bostrichidophilus]
MKKIIILNGPNINKIGIREPKIYGNIDINDYLLNLKNKYIKKNIKLYIYNYNNEGKIIDFLYKIYKIKKKIFLIINLGAFTHTSLAISDAIKIIKNKIYLIEVHVSNIFNREKIRNNSLISSLTNGIIIGFGVFSYELAIISIIKNKLFF